MSEILRKKIVSVNRQIGYKNSFCYWNLNKLKKILACRCLTGLTSNYNSSLQHKKGTHVDRYRDDSGLVYIEDRSRLVSLYRERFEFCPAFATCAARSQLRNGIEPLWHSSQSSLLLSMEKQGEEERKEQEENETRRRREERGSFSEPKA